jgi:hypothetical protein
MAFLFTNNIRCPKHGELGMNLPFHPENRLILPKDVKIGKLIFHGGDYLDKLIIESTDGYVMGILDGSKENGMLKKQVIAL